MVKILRTLNRRNHACKRSNVNDDGNGLNPYAHHLLANQAAVGSEVGQRFERLPKHLSKAAEVVEKMIHPSADETKNESHDIDYCKYFPKFQLLKLLIYELLRLISNTLTKKERANSPAKAFGFCCSCMRGPDS